MGPPMIERSQAVRQTHHVVGDAPIDSAPVECSGRPIPVPSTRFAELFFRARESERALDRDRVRFCLQRAISGVTIMSPRVKTPSVAPFRLLICGLLFACEPKYVVGSWDCGSPELPREPGSVMPSLDPVGSWETSFENGFCDYVLAHGFCALDSGASYEIVDSPVRSGASAAAFSITTDGSPRGEQSRCVREGGLPRHARYSAWFYIPEPVENRATWNLMHFQGGEPRGDLHYLWDVSLGTGDDGELFAYVFDFVNDADDAYIPESRRAIPIGRWFQLEFRWLRSAREDGEVALYQDGELLLELGQRVTDDTGWGQWYVGNYADRLVPPDSTVYVDDVSIRTVP
jgi:hypothetical protein